MTVKRDKILHVETAMLIVVIVSLLFSVWVGAIVAAVASVGKEVWDKYHGGVPSWADLCADLIGVGLGSLLAWLTIVCNTFV
jgi:hypothetical protein